LAQKAGFAGSRNYDIIPQKSTAKGEKSAGRTSKLDTNKLTTQNYNSTSKTLGAINAISPPKTRGRNEASKVGVRNNSQSVSKLTFANKAKAMSSYNSVSKTKN